MKQVTYYAHSANDIGRWHRLSEHLGAVRDLATIFAEPLGLSEEAALAALLHDIGKYGDLFQKRLHGLAKGIDHWSAGAWIAILRKASAAALVVQGHHIGLKQMERRKLKALAPEKLAANHPLQLSLSHSSPEELLTRFHSDGLQLGAVSKPIYVVGEPKRTGTMLDTRMLFSCVVDADFVDTEAHFQGGPEGKVYRASGPSLEPEKALALLTRHVEEVAQRCTAGDEVRRLRADLWNSCLDAGKAAPGVWTLTAPTGGGKTLAMLGFALRQAVEHGLRRVIMVVPYLSIIEQSAGILRKIFEPAFGPDYLLEHHSLTQTGDEEDETDPDSDGHRRARLHSQNWDAPLIVTTSVQCLESLFSNRPAACRKLHRTAGSVLLFDEVQTLPPGLAIPTLATLSRLATRYRSTVVFATATQPAFEHLSDVVASRENESWRPRELARPELGLFKRVRRVAVRWPTSREQRMSWDDVVGDLAALEQVLCVVNVTSHARELAQRLRLAVGSAGLFHLSTRMCPVHREQVLKEVRRRLDASQVCRLVATQCVEAGVDIDFPVVYRALGPLEGIAQAAGRCNREGANKLGRVVVFVPEDESYPPGVYELATDVTAKLLKQAGDEGLDIDDPATFDHYYRDLYDMARPDEMKEALSEAIASQDFEVVSKEYRLIPQDRVNVLVPYDGGAFEKLVEELNAKYLTRKWQRRAQRYAVSLLRGKTKEVEAELVAAPLYGGHVSNDWFYHARPGDYDPLLGLLPGRTGSRIG